MLDEETVLGHLIDLAREVGPAFTWAAFQKATGLEMEAVDPSLSKLMQCDIVHWWDDPDHGASLVLGAGLCAKLGIDFPEPRRPKRRKTRTISETDLPYRSLSEAAPFCLDRVPDPSAIDPYLATAEGEGVEYGDGADRADYLTDRPPYPRVLLGERLQWPVAGQETVLPTIRTGKCAGCRGRRLSPVTYCLVCDRYGYMSRLGSTRQKA